MGCCSDCLQEQLADRHRGTDLLCLVFPDRGGDCQIAVRRWALRKTSKPHHRPRPAAPVVSRVDVPPRRCGRYSQGDEPRNRESAGIRTRSALAGRSLVLFPEVIERLVDGLGGRNVPHACFGIGIVIGLSRYLVIPDIALEVAQRPRSRKAFACSPEDFPPCATLQMKLKASMY